MCLNECELRNSHIIPEFCFRPGYDAKGRLVRVTRDGTGPPFIQQGPTEPLLGDCCEQRLNKHYESPFQKKWYGEVLPKVAPPEQFLAVKGLDYAAFKLFHLSVLWRMSVSAFSPWTKVKLGPHRDRIRRMLLERDPGPVTQYQIAGELLVGPRTSTVANGTVMGPIAQRKEGRHVYTVAFAGCAWHYSVASHPAAGADAIVLQPDGSMNLPVLDIVDFPPFDRFARKGVQARRRRREKGRRSPSM